MDVNNDLVTSELVIKRDKLSPVAAEKRLGPIEILVNNASLFSAFNFSMTLSPKTITVFLDASPAGEKRAAHAASLAQRWRAHLVGIHAVFSGVVLPASMCWARGDEALRQVVDYERHLDSNAEATASQVGEHFRVLCNDLKVSGEFRPIGREDTVYEAIRIALHSDLVVVGHPEPNGLPDDLSIDKLLLESSAPLLILPTAWKGKTIGNKILIGWNETREARRAVADAMPFLVAAESVTVLVIDPDEGCHQHSDNRGSDLAICVRRYGATIDLDQVASRGHSISTVLLGYAEQSASDLLVVGAYSHPRLKEVLLGGTTRTLLEKTSMPTLMSR